MQATHVAIIDDHAISSAGLTALLAKVDGVAVVARISDPWDAARLLSARQVHVAIFNLANNSDAIMDTTARILEETQLFKRIPTLLITPPAPYARLLQLVKLGVQGYVVVDVSEWVLVRSVLAVAAGCSVYFPRDVIRKLIGDARAPQPNARPDEVLLLTPQERRVLGYVARGLSNQEISRELQLAETTVKKHLSHAMRKVKVRDRLQAAIYVNRHGLELL